MRFELTPALIDEILYSMQDQGGEFFLDTREAAIVGAAAPGTPDRERCVALPKWDPADGFRLMGRFAAQLRNAPAREELSAALDSGRGVFRTFKNALAKYPETEKLWFAYKDSEMKRKVIAWYNALREAWGLELIGEEPEDIAALALEDFRFREGTPADAALANELRRACMEERRRSADRQSAAAESAGENAAGESIADDGKNANNVEGAGSESAADIFAGMGEWAFPGDISLVVESAGGDFAGYASAVRSSACGAADSGAAAAIDIDTAAVGKGAGLRICAVEVHAEYRGLGLGKSLVSRLLEQADSQGIAQVVIDLPAEQEYFARVLLREFFRPCAQRYARERPSSQPGAD